jgi:hypothetical protein
MFKPFMMSAVFASMSLVGCAVDSAPPERDDPAPADDQAQANATEATVSQDIGEACGHSLCEVGAAVTATCDRCAFSICSQDGFCCASSWDSICVGEVSSICGLGPVPVTASTQVSAINVKVTTGGDDLRGGSQASGQFQVNGFAIPASPINNGAGFGANSVNNATLSLSGTRTLGSLTGFTLLWDGAPRNIFDSYDNWDANQLVFSVSPGGTGRCPTVLGAPFAPGRMTGSRTSAFTTVRFP